jgi:hypothetical protein
MRMAIVTLALLSMLALFFLGSIDLAVDAVSADYGYPYPAPVTPTPGITVDPWCQEARLLDQPLPAWCVQTQPPTPTTAIDTQPQPLPTLPAVIQRHPGKGPMQSGKKGMPHDRPNRQ